MSIPKLIIEENILYCDLDGVLVDFEAGVKERMKKLPHELNRTSMWITLRKTPNFYAKLPWMPEGKALWDAIFEEAGYTYDQWLTDANGNFILDPQGNKIPTFLTGFFNEISLLLLI